MADTTPALDLRTGSQRTFLHLLVSTLVVSVMNFTVWFAVTFWVYLETSSVFATGLIAGIFLVSIALTGIWFGSLVDHHHKKTVMLWSAAVSMVLYGVCLAIYLTTPDATFRDPGSARLWVFVVLLMLGVVAGNLRTIAMPTLVTLLIPEDRRDKANGLVGTVNGVAFAITSVFSGLAIGLLGMGAALAISIVLTVVALVHLMTITVAEEKPEPHHDDPKFIDIAGALRAVRIVPGLMALLLFSTFNNFLGGVFMALMDPYGLSLMSVEAWGVMLGITSMGFIVGGILVARRGLGANPVRTLLLANIVLWSITLVFPIRSEILPLALGFFLYMALAPVAEASEQTIVQKVVPFKEQGRVFGFAQSLETAASPVTAFLIGPIAQFLVIPAMTDGAGADAIGSWFGTGPERGMALIFIVAGGIGLLVTILALRSKAYRNLSARYAAARSSDDRELEGVPAT